MTNHSAEIKQAKAEARKQKIINLFNENTKIVVAFSIAFLVLSLVFFGYKIYQKSNQEKFSGILYQSLVDQQVGETERAKKSLKEIYEAKSAPRDIKSIASLRYAAMLLEENKKSDAIKAYLQVSDCKFCDKYLRDLASLLVVKIWISDDLEIKKPDLLSRVEKIENNSKILKNYISEQKAILYMKNGNLEKSYKIFESIIKDPKSSKDLNSRSSDALKILIAKGYDSSLKNKNLIDKKE